jgi:hypothetical protein
MAKIVKAMVGAGLAAAAVPALAQSGGAQEIERKVDRFSLSASTGIDFSKGDYGLAADTEILVVPFSVRAKSGAFSFSATIPWIRLEGPSGVLIGPGGEPLPGVPTVGGRRKGLGDLNLGATWKTPVGEALDFGLGARVKLPTSPRSRGLTTGETDFTGSAELTWTSGSLAPFVSLGYRLLGDPAGVDLRSGPTASAGATLKLREGTVLIGSYDYARASSRLAEDSHELFGGVSARLSKRFSLTGYGVAGLSEGSPDFGLGLLLTVGVF